MAALVQQAHPVTTLPVIRPMSEPHDQFQYGMTILRPNSSMVSQQGSMPQDLSGCQQEISFMQQINNPN